MKSFFPERDELRWEVRQNVAATITFFPKVVGKGNVTAEASGNSYTVKDRNGQIVQASASVAPTQNANGTSRFELAIPAIAELREDYRVELLWLELGDATVYRSDIQFDSVLRPWSRTAPGISLADMQQIRPFIHKRIERQAKELQLTIEERAGDIAYQARVELDSMIRTQIHEDRVRLMNVPGTTSFQRQDDGLRPRLIISQGKLQRVEQKLAIKIVFEGETKMPGSEDEETARLLSYFSARVNEEWARVNPLEYDENEDAEEDLLIEDIGRSVNLRRV